MHWLGLGPMVGWGLGAASPKSWRSGCERATLATGLGTALGARLLGEFGDDPDR